jgi:hypothetical protein
MGMFKVYHLEHEKSRNPPLGTSTHKTCILTGKGWSDVLSVFVLEENWLEIQITPTCTYIPHAHVSLAAHIEMFSKLFGSLRNIQTNVSKVEILEGQWFWYSFLTLESSLKTWFVPHILFYVHHSLNNWFEAFPHSPRVLDGIAKLHSPLLLV